MKQAQLERHAITHALSASQFTTSAICVSPTCACCSDGLLLSLCHQEGRAQKACNYPPSILYHRLQPALFVSHQVVLAAAVACCWICARKRAERKRHAALGGKVPAALPDIEQPAAQESAAVEQAETEQPTKPLQEGQTMSHPVEQFKMPGASGHYHGIPLQHIRAVCTVIVHMCCLSNTRLLLM